MSNYMPTVPPRSNERLQQLELLIQEYKKRVQDLENENKYYKNHCVQLENQVSKMRSTVFINANDGNKDSIAAINDPFVDVAAVNLCEDIEMYLEETKFNLTDETKIKISFETLFNKLTDLVRFQYGSKDLKQLNDLKLQLIAKLSEIEDKIKNYQASERKWQDLEKQYEKVNIELNALKATLNCKQLVDTNQVDILSNEFIKWKDEIKSINEKVLQQYSLVQKLVSKCDPIIDDAISKNNSLASNVLTNQEKNTNSNENNNNNLYVRPNANDNTSPGNSPTQGIFNLLRPSNNRGDDNQEFKSFQMIDHELNTIQSNNSDKSKENSYNGGNDEDHRTIIPAANNPGPDNAEGTLYQTYADDDNAKSLDIFQCPMCNIQVSKDSIRFETFFEHASKCSPEQLTCVFCLKLFPKAKEDDYVKHVQEHDG